jgi:hypothetical protein
VKRWGGESTESGSAPALTEYGYRPQLTPYEWGAEKSALLAIF